MPRAFAVSDCALLAVATGRHAQSLREFRDHLENVHPSSLYHHFWGSLLRPHFDDPEFRNDFAAWAYRALNDSRLAEKLAIIDPTEFDDLEFLRQAVLDEVEERLDETEVVPTAGTDQQFHFVRSQIVVFDTRVRFKSPRRLASRIPRMSVGSIFYHFIDARRRNADGIEDFSTWLLEFDDAYLDLVERLAAIDPYFGSLVELRAHLASNFSSHFRKEGS